jgi:hypothetical protein
MHHALEVAGWVFAGERGHEERYEVLYRIPLV